MKRIFEHRKIRVAGVDREELDQRDRESFRHYPGFGGKPEYFPASIIQMNDSEGNTVNDLRIFEEALVNPDVEIPEGALIRTIRGDGTKRPKWMYWITMYNENFGQLLQSLAGCIRSIWELNQMDDKEYAPNKFGIVLVWDGIDKVDQEFMNQLQDFNMFDPEIWYNTVLKTDVNNNQVKRKFDKNSTSLGNDGEEGLAAKRYSYATQNVGHIFSKVLKDEDLRKMLDVKQELDPNAPAGTEQLYQCQLHDKEKEFGIYHWTKEGAVEEIPDINFFFCAKHENRGKIESHLWFFKGFCAYLNPEYCQMIDIGTVPLKKSISLVVTYMDFYPQVGGAAGEIEVFEPTDNELGYPKYEKNENGVVKVINRSIWEKIECFWLVLAQYVEYKISHYLDKAFETQFGFVSVLPGAFCTFRWEAIEGDPLKSFFKGLEADKHTAKEANMYLAEDRVMCLEILRRYSKNWVLRYLPGCKALTDPPTSIIGLLKQRRRWTNGSLFASWYVIDHLNLITRSDHSYCRKFSLMLLYIYMIFNFMFSLLLVGSLFASFSIFIRAFFNDEKCYEFGGAKIFESAYLGLLFIFVLMSITKPIEKSQLAYTVMVLIFGVFIFVSVALGFVYFWENTENEIVAWLLLGTMIGSYVVPPLLNIRSISIWRYALGVPILIFFSPMYINIFIIYSMANLHDISWGNRETNSQKSLETKKNLEQFRAIYLIVWIAFNSIYGYTIIYITREGQRVYILILTLIISLTVLLKLFFAVSHFFYHCCSDMYKKIAKDKKRGERTIN